MELNTTDRERKALMTLAQGQPFGRKTMDMAITTVLGLVTDVNMLSREVQSLRQQLQATTNRQD